MTTIRAKFDGKAFVPEQPIVLPDQCEALVLIEGTDPVAQRKLDDAIRAYYQAGVDDDDDAWDRGTASDGARAWDED